MLKPRLSSDFLLLLSALFMSFVIWLIAKQTEIEVSSLLVRVIEENKPDNCEVKIMPSFAEIKVQYSKAQKRFIAPSNFNVVVNLKDIEAFAGIQEFKSIPFPLTVADVDKLGIPQTIKALAIIDPKTVIVQVKLNTAEARVEPVAKGSLPANYRLIQPLSVSPEKVLITGSQSLLNSLRDKENQIKLYTEPIDLTNKKDSFFNMVRIITPEGIKLVNEDDSLVRVVAAVGEVKQRKVFDNVPIVIKVFSENLRAEYSPQTARVTVEAPISRLDNISEDSFTFNPSQPLDESEGFSAVVALEARFSENTSLDVRETATIVDYEPKAIKLKLVAREKEKATETPAVSPEKVETKEQ